MHDESRHNSTYIVISPAWLGVFATRARHLVLALLRQFGVALRQYDSTLAFLNWVAEHCSQSLSLAFGDAIYSGFRCDPLRFCIYALPWYRELLCDQVSIVAISPGSQQDSSSCGDGRWYFEPDPPLGKHSGVVGLQKRV